MESSPPVRRYLGSASTSLQATMILNGRLVKIAIQIIFGLLKTNRSDEQLSICHVLFPLSSWNKLV